MRPSPLAARTMSVPKNLTELWRFKKVVLEDHNGKYGCPCAGAIDDAPRAPDVDADLRPVPQPMGSPPGFLT
jgi:hypothetical protein